MFLSLHYKKAIFTHNKKEKIAINNRIYGKIKKFKFNGGKLRNKDNKEYRGG